MFCPKCKQTFEEGSRRFCPTDGSRLVSDTAAADTSRKGGIFANLIPQMEGVRDLEETLSDAPRIAPVEAAAPSPPIPVKAGEEDEIFFEFDDVKPNFIAEKEFAKTVNAPVASTPRPAARKVNPYEIPAGHVDLDDNRSSAFTIDFNENDPEGFVGRIVKGRYKVTEFLGGDESGLAYLADDKIVEDKKVLVRILVREEEDEIMRSILVEERVSLSHFSHPNIARMIDSGEFTGGTQFLVSEFVDALSVRDILDIHGQFGSERAARVIRQAAGALNEAHEAGILHRDVRPANLILNVDGDAEQTMLVNFGASNGDPTPENFVYKAPEVLDGRVATASSDVFSLAVVGYEMLTSRLPFEGATAKELIRVQSAGMPDAGLPTAVADVLARALAPKPADRFAKAREFGDAFHGALAESPEVALPAVPAASVGASAKADKPIVPQIVTVPPAVGDEPAWTRRSPEPPQVETSRGRKIALFGILGLLAILAIGWIYITRNSSEPQLPPTEQSVIDQQNAINTGIEVPPAPRSIPQPPNTNFYQNSKQNLKGDLLLNFVGFSMYYPKEWKVNGPQPGENVNTRGKFIDITREDAQGRMREQMLVSYYASKGTFNEDKAKFPQMVKETNETLKKLPGYQMLSEGEIKFNGDWRAYEVKFQGFSTTPSGEKFLVWGRRLFIPAARPGVRNGFEITMLATSYADEVRSVDDVGIRGELGPILFSFEPSQTF